MLSMQRVRFIAIIPPTHTTCVNVLHDHERRTQVVGKQGTFIICVYCLHMVFIYLFIQFMPCLFASDKVPKASYKSAKLQNTLKPYLKQPHTIYTK